MQSLAKPFYFTAQFCCKQWKNTLCFRKKIRNSNSYNKQILKAFRQCMYNENHLYFIFYYMFDNCNDYEIVSLYFVAIQAFTRTQAIVSTYSKQFKVNSDTK